MDYVGPSFDCGEISKGKAAHETWNIPWEEVPFMKDTAIRKFKVFEIPQEAYIETAKERIKTLINYYPHKKDEIMQAMPTTFKAMPIQMFRDIRDKVIFPLYLQHRELIMDGLKSFGIELNIVQDGRLVPMELQVPERFSVREEESER